MSSANAMISPLSTKHPFRINVLLLNVVIVTYVIKFNSTLVLNFMFQNSQGTRAKVHFCVMSI